ncbi:MAG: DUF1508 domain-containing protein [Chloroflexi bacterium]|nr:MAG: DUF1508 domain-containing protein [Chloroflexota bacterium]
MKNPKFEIYQGSNGKYYFRLFAKNGQKILSGQGYAAKAGCKNGVESVKTNAPNDDLYERKESSNGKFYFNLLAANKQIIGTSQMYAGKPGRDNGIEAVKRAVADAGVAEAL